MEDISMVARLFYHHMFSFGNSTAHYELIIEHQCNKYYGNVIFLYKTCKTS